VAAQLVASRVTLSCTESDNPSGLQRGLIRLEKESQQVVFLVRIAARVCGPGTKRFEGNQIGRRGSYRLAFFAAALHLPNMKIECVCVDNVPNCCRSGDA
jgi:hypothetical protein